MYYIYILRCAGGSLYTGITPNLARRMRQHCGELKGGAKYTRSHPPEALICVWQTDSHTAAAKFEIAYKQLSRSQKLHLIAAPNCWLAFLPQLEAYCYTPFPAKPLEQYLKQFQWKSESC